MAMKQRPPSPNGPSTPSSTRSLASMTTTTTTTSTGTSPVRGTKLNYDDDDNGGPSKRSVRRSVHVQFNIHRDKIITILIAASLFLSGSIFQWFICTSGGGGGAYSIDVAGLMTSSGGNGDDGSSSDSSKPISSWSSSSSLRGPAVTQPKVTTTTTSTMNGGQHVMVAANQQQQQQSPAPTPLDCDFYLAESSIPHGGLGVFTAIAIPEGGPAQPFPDVCLYVTNADKRIGTEIGSHTWQSYRFGAQFLGGEHVRGQCLGLVTMFNSMGVKQYSSARPAAVRELIHTHGGLHRSKDPGAGAISYFYGASSITRRNVQPGDELLLWDNGFGGSSYEDIGSVSGFQTNSSIPEELSRKQVMDETEDKDDGEDEDSHHLSVPPYRSPAWLQKHGMCMDHIKIGPATDPAMGRGAFANRFLPHGTLVAPAPVQIFYNRTLFQPPEYTDDDYSWPEELIVNYCFQPKGSSMLLFPYGAGVGMINHSRDPSKVNVQLRWSNHPMSHTSWLDEEMSIRQFQKVQYPGSLVLEYVAIRDIAEDEEIFIDYGKEWEQAWKNHVENWKPSRRASEYQYVSDMDRTQPFRTEQEQGTDPYPKNVKTVCDSRNPFRKDLSGDKDVIWERGGNYWPESLVSCSILKRKENTIATTDEERAKDPYLYDVEWLQRRKSEDGERKKIVEVNVPHSAIGFVDRPYESDQFLSNAFRHPMIFPAEMTPSQWLLKNQ